MGAVVAIVLRISKVLNTIASAALIFMMCITVADVLSRAGGHPIMGTYETVGLLGAIVIGFAVPFASCERGHIYMEFLVDRLPKGQRDILNIFTRLLCIALFLFIGYNLFQVGADFYKAGEVTPTLKLPFFPVAYGLGICCFIECLVFACDIVKIREDKYV